VDALPPASHPTDTQYIIAQASLVCFELTAMNVLISYWTPDLHPAILISAGLASYAAFQLWSVRIFGELEFWLSITKVLLMLGLTAYTFITMVGGNPIGDKYGFRFWKTPGPFVGETPALRMKGVFDALVWACFAWVEPHFTLDILAKRQRRRSRLDLPGGRRGQVAPTDHASSLQFHNLPNPVLLRHWCPVCRCQLGLGRPQPPRCDRSGSPRSCQVSLHHL